MGLFNRKKDDDNNKKSVKDTDSVKVESKKEVKKEKSMKELYSEEAKPKKSTEDNKKKSTTGMAYKILVKPLITEKVTNLGSENKYVFEVSLDANKVEIKKAIEEVYGVQPVNINIVRMKGKKVRYGRVSGKKKNWKKAIITLKKGDVIKVYEGV